MWHVFDKFRIQNGSIRSNTFLILILICFCRTVVSLRKYTKEDVDNLR